MLADKFEFQRQLLFLACDAFPSELSGESKKYFPFKGRNMMRNAVNVRKVCCTQHF